jgi:hypothetical protein
MDLIHPQLCRTVDEDTEIFNFENYSQPDGLVYQRTVFETREKIVRTSIRQKYFGRLDGLVLRVVHGDKEYECFNRVRPDSSVIGLARKDGCQKIFWKNRVDGLVRSELTPDSYLNEWFDNRDDGKMFQRCRLGNNAIESKLREFSAEMVEVHTGDRSPTCADMCITYDVQNKSMILHERNSLREVSVTQKVLENANELIKTSLEELKGHFIECTKCSNAEVICR